jgi:hypothetical protein
LLYRHDHACAAAASTTHSGNPQQTRRGRAEYLPTLLIVQHRQAFDPT